MSHKDQVGGDPYSRLTIRPLDVTAALYGRVGVEAALINLVLEYLMCRKESRLLDLDKAIDCIERLKELEKDK